VLDGDWSGDADGVSDVDNRTLYAGYHHDSETGLYHVRNRMYHPTLGRWVQRDPLGYVDGMSVYEYCRSSTVIGIDPSGLGFWGHVGSFFKGVGDAVVGTAQFVGETAVGAYDTARLSYGAAKWAITGDPTTLAEMETTDRRADPNWQPRFAEVAEKTYNETGSIGLAIADATLEGSKVVPVVGTGVRLGENIDNAIQKGEWDETNTRSLGQTAGEVAILEVVRRVGNKPIGPSRTPPSATTPKPAGNFKTPTNAPQQPCIPKGYVPELARSGNGTVWRPPGTTGNACTVRVMKPTAQYPNGYWVRYNVEGYAVNPSTGVTGAAHQTHVPLPTPPSPSIMPLPKTVPQTAVPLAPAPTTQPSGPQNDDTE
jgi:RHS repeat-associated protein